MLRVLAYFSGILFCVAVIPMIYVNASWALVAALVFLVVGLLLSAIGIGILDVFQTEEADHRYDPLTTDQQTLRSN
jgi:uncharacterized membrane protein